MGRIGGKRLHTGDISIKMERSRRSQEDQSLEQLPIQGGVFKFKQIRAATRNFNSANKIGEGGFGPVYKGVLPNGMAIAVKQLSSKSKQGTAEFINEIGAISALKHPNIVRLLGSCIEQNQLLLVYEFMENNSLARALFGPGDIKLELNWSTRIKICLGIAKALAFLHEGSKLNIVHRDIKASNVLLDKDLTAKISDFGLAKHQEEEETHISTRIAGTIGYMAPEYAMRGYLTNKADVYSFGIVTLEIVSGKKNADYRPSDEELVYLLDLAYVLQQKGNLLQLIDPVLGMDFLVKEATRVLDLAMLCTNPSPTLRPTMSEVVSILEGKTRMKALPVHAPYSTDYFERAKALVEPLLSAHYGSTSKEETPNTFSSCVIEQEISTSKKRSTSSRGSLEIPPKVQDITFMELYQQGYYSRKCIHDVSPDLDAEEIYIRAYDFPNVRFPQQPDYDKVVPMICQSRDEAIHMLWEMFLRLVEQVAEFSFSRRGVELNNIVATMRMLSYAQFNLDFLRDHLEEGFCRAQQSIENDEAAIAVAQKQRDEAVKKNKNNQALPEARAHLEELRKKMAALKLEITTAEDRVKEMEGGMATRTDVNFVETLTSVIEQKGNQLQDARAQITITEPIMAKLRDLAL